MALAVATGIFLITAIMGFTHEAGATEPPASPARPLVPSSGLQRDLGTTMPVSGPARAAAATAGVSNAIVVENRLPGNLSTEWDITGDGDQSIQGFATDISVDHGQRIGFKIDTDAAAYRLDIYRMGWYGGRGARKVTTLQPSAILPQAQPDCIRVPTTGLVDCGNWQLSASWDVPTTATSGIYFAKLVRNDTGGASHIVFVVRDDERASDLLFQTSDTTWQAYNEYGGNSLYTGSPGNDPTRAYKVSYNRPFMTRSNRSTQTANGQDFVFHAEYPMVRWLEANGYDVSYFTGVDADRLGSSIHDHKVFLSVGHDEYWSGAQRANVEAARNVGVNLAFFSGNEIFWKTRWEPAADGSQQPYRTMVCYKETHYWNDYERPLDTLDNPTDKIWTGSWRDPRNSPPADGGRPENSLIGTIFTVNDGATTAIKVPQAEGRTRFWRNTSIATLGAGKTATLAARTLGYEWDEDLDNGYRPAGLIRMSKTTVANAPVLLDYGHTFGSGTATHRLTLYKHPSGARVFGSGSVQWSWGLDGLHDGGNSSADARMRQATVNLFADMGVQPGSLQSGLILAVASTDTTAPASVITSPIAGAKLTAGKAATVAGTAADAVGGVVGGVEVSVNGGASWHPATGLANWTYKWTPRTSGTLTLRSRAVDDSGNLEQPGAGTIVTVGTASPPPPGGAVSLWGGAAIPAVAADPDAGGVELGVRFRSDVDGTVTGVMFYKGRTNTGTHIASLWTAGGALLAQKPFAGETASGWQQVLFAAPVPIQKNVDYVVSYHTTVGHYAVDDGYFTIAGVDAPPLHALRNGVGGANGLYTYGGSATLPTSSYHASNYWVDVLFKQAP